ncbi:MAG TPA: hypothetical protein VF745_13885 [Steroidobacteraceae bacterium]
MRASVHASGGPENGGLPVNEWAAVVDRASNPAVPVDLYAGPLSRWGTASDPLIGESVGGVIDFGGGARPL